ncbi:MAG: AbrB/MazE/SpoVT family DNA-binding domain-containing protein [Nitrososphaerales archaeon]
MISKLETVRVKRKGQVTIPADLRRRHGIREGDLLGIETKDDRTIVMKLKEPPEPGLPVGSGEQKRILEDLKKLRGRWR